MSILCPSSPSSSRLCYETSSCQFVPTRTKLLGTRSPTQLPIPGGQRIVGLRTCSQSPPPHPSPLPCREQISCSASKNRVLPLPPAFLLHRCIPGPSHSSHFPVQACSGSSLVHTQLHLPCPFPPACGGSCLQSWPGSLLRGGGGLQIPDLHPLPLSHLQTDPHPPPPGHPALTY